MTRRLLFLLLIWVCGFTSLSGRARSQPNPLTRALPAASASGATTPAPHPDSPAASLGRYLDLTRRGKYPEAAAYLQLPRGGGARGAELAERLRRVLDRHGWPEISRVSSEPNGDGNDRRPFGVDQIAEVPDADGKPVAVLLTRVAGPEGVRWLFTRATVERVDELYAELDERWLLDRLPTPLLRPGPGNLLWWQWLALPLLLVAAWSLGLVIGRISAAIGARLARKTSRRWDDEWVVRLTAPWSAAWAVVLLFAAVPWLRLYPPAQATVSGVLRVALLVILFWALLRAFDLVAGAVGNSPWASSHPASRSLVTLASRVAKVALFAMAIIALFSQLGYPVASLIAGLGIGGLALALAAQKTVENLFGAFSIGVDQPIREGEFVDVEGVKGTVESIGLRSTRLRTPARTVVTIPNGKLAEMRLESFAARDRMHLGFKVGIEYGATAAQIEDIIESFEAALRAHPKVFPDGVDVSLVGFGESALELETNAWFRVPWDEFVVIRQALLLEFMQIVERVGTRIAMPARRVHVARDLRLAEQVQQAP
jgi:MscS family membrane protein